jgi:hypothetical protein
MTEPAQTEGKNDSTTDEQLASKSTALTQLSYKQPLVTDLADCIQGGLKIHKMYHIPSSEKKKGAAIRNFRVCSAQK